MDDVESVLRRLDDFELWHLVNAWRTLLRHQQAGSLPAPVRNGFDFGLVHCSLLRFMPGVIEAGPEPLQQVLAGSHCIRSLREGVAYFCPAAGGCGLRPWRQMRVRTIRESSGPLSS